MFGFLHVAFGLCAVMVALTVLASVFDGDFENVLKRTGLCFMFVIFSWVMRKFDEDEDQD